MNVADNSRKRNSSGAKPGWELESGPSKGSRIYRSRSNPDVRSSFFFNCKVRKNDAWWWEHRAKPGYVRSILRQLTLSSGRLSLSADKLSLSASKDLNRVVGILAVSDKSPGQDHIPWSDPSTAGVTTGRVVKLTQSEWSYWKRRIRRDREVVVGIDTVYSIPQQDGSMVLVVSAAYSIIGGKVYEGEVALATVLAEVLESHDRSRRIRGNHGSQKTADRDRSGDMEWVETTELTHEEFFTELRALKDEGKVKWVSKRERDGNVKHDWAVVPAFQAEVTARLKLLPRSHPKNASQGS